MAESPPRLGPADRLTPLGPILRTPALGRWATFARARGRLAAAALAGWFGAWFLAGIALELARRLS